jgi:hypothetical protein
MSQMTSKHFAGNIETLYTVPFKAMFISIKSISKVSAKLSHGVQKQLKNTRQTMTLLAVENIRKVDYALKILHI